MKHRMASSRTIGVTMGDPLGIGAEIILKALSRWKGRSSIKVFGDPHLLKELPRGELQPISLGSSGRKPTAEEAGQASVAYLDAAMAAWRSGGIDALVTAPIAKHHVNLAGFPFPGHTEYLAAQTKTEKFAMMMAGPKLKVTLVTIHEPLKRVPELLSVAKILETIEITHRALRERFGIAKPRLAVCGLNPHAGEEGLLGREEIELIAPAIAEARRRGFDCAGPKVPDAVFHEAYQGNWDALVCMYHDQGLIPFKMVHFADGVNVTLGLPLVRTSPDHGTAFDIAGQGKADPSSMIAALKLAEEMLG
ncbi:MAG TPA: 4-hydroxythreonine-4-phosphate dehydrogenase PdxA [bacterium]|nr:4-hydroxythreonine-4-phosphate dehydrogenase PdxA [bacterium]